MTEGSHEIDEKLQNAITTLSSNIQQLKSLASLVTVTQPAVDADKGDTSKGGGGGGASAMPNNLENVHPNLQSLLLNQEGEGQPSTLQASFQNFDEILEELKQVEHAVSSLEEKMSLLKTVISDESAVLAQLEKTKVAAMSQQQTIAIMKDEIEPLKHELPGTANTGTSRDTRGTTDATAPTTVGRKQSTGSKPSVANKQVSQTTSTVAGTTVTRKRSKKSDKDKIPWGKELVTLHPISKQEFNGISRNIRGRIKLSALNDALVDITTVSKTKYEILRRKHLKNKSSKAKNSSDKNQARKSTKQYQVTLALHRRLILDDHGDFEFVSEQELRDSCAFFRLGESTARAILQILRSAKRLKQVYGQNSVVTYILLEGGGDEREA